MIKVSLMALLIGATFVSATPGPPPTDCAVIVLRDYELGWAYYAQVRLTASCPPGGSARVRKSSSINTIIKGAGYQPIRPEAGAWTVDGKGDNIPNKFQFTLNNWDWQYYSNKKWIRAEVR